jgi:hypothetical protein
MASLPGPHKSLIQKASRGSGWGFKRNIHPNFGTLTGSVRPQHLSIQALIGATRPIETASYYRPKRVRQRTKRNGESTARPCAVAII